MLTLLAFAFLLGHCWAQNPWTPQARDSHWLQVHQQLLTTTQQHGSDAKLIFIGDSITEGWQWTPQSKDIWAKHYTPRHAYNYGVGGDKTEHVLWRIANKEFDGMNPKVATLMIGTNNLGSNNIQDISRGVQEVLKQLHAKLPNTKIILLGVLPRNPNVAQDKPIRDLNELIKKFADEKSVFWLDMWSSFAAGDHFKSELYLPDNLHLNPSGYQVWQQTMEPLLSRLFA